MDHGLRARGRRRSRRSRASSAARSRSTRSAPAAADAFAEVFDLDFEELPGDEPGLWAQPLHRSSRRASSASVRAFGALSGGWIAFRGKNARSLDSRSYRGDRGRSHGRRDTAGSVPYVRTDVLTSVRMQGSLPVAERPRRPEWMKVRAPSANTRYFDVKKLIHGASLNTICEEARCPNIAECWGRGTATFQILGETCTRACRYCYVNSGTPSEPVDPARAAAARADGEGDGAEARRRHLGRPRRRPRPGAPATTRRRSAR